MLRRQETSTRVICMGLAWACFTTTLAVAQPPPANPRPNVLVMMADDMGMGDTSAYQDITGNSDDVQVATPQMERLAHLGVRFTDAHATSTRCTGTRYGLLTGRYPWRNRMKHWVLFGVQGDPMIEADRPTLATMLRDHGYRTAMVGKWHVGLRYRQANGEPAAGWDDADLKQPLHTTPIDHGFDYARFTSRSHGTSGPKPDATGANQRGPGHIHDRTVVGATGFGKQLVKKGANAYVLEKLGGRHSDHAIEFLESHCTDADTRKQPFFLYYAANSNHSPYTPDVAVGDVPVSGAARSKAGQPMNKRYDYIYENDVALGRMLDWLETTDDPRDSNRKLIDTTIVIFTSDNGAERREKVATGPFRSNKGSAYEGGHRVPFLVAWPSGGVGNGDASTLGLDSDALIAHHDLYATLVDALGGKLPDLREGEKGAEDSSSVWRAWQGEPLTSHPPLIINDHSEAREDRAACAVRVDSPVVQGQRVPGKWKLFFDASLIRFGEANPYELYNLATDPREEVNLIERAELRSLVEFLTEMATLHRNVGGHRLADFGSHGPIRMHWDPEAEGSLAARFHDQPAGEVTVNAAAVVMTVQGEGENRHSNERRFDCNEHGLGIRGGLSTSVDHKEALLIRFDRDVIVESLAVVAANGTCGGFYRVGEQAPLAIYCVDADNDAQDQRGNLSDIGVIPAGVSLRIDSSPHFSVEAAGDWRLGAISFRLLDER